MTYTLHDPIDDSGTLPRRPSWIAVGGSEDADGTHFFSGASLGHMHLVVGHRAVPHALWRGRLAVRAAAAVSGFIGRTERMAEVRDELHLTRPGDLHGPAGALGQAWARLVTRPLTVAHLAPCCGLAPETVAEAFDAGTGDPVARGAAVLRHVLTEHPRREAAALMLADVALAQSLRWSRVVPLLALGLARRDMRDARAEACHRAVVKAVVQADRDARDLAMKAAHLRAVAGQLRGKQADAAVGMFLTRDAVAPWELTHLMSPRAARRLCERLIDLGAVREMTGRDTYRIYGL
jgi:hypothetical protein